MFLELTSYFSIYFKLESSSYSNGKCKHIFVRTAW